jgi:hypothetical protein
VTISEKSYLDLAFSFLGEEMSTNRRAVEDDPELANLQRGDTLGAMRAQRVKNDEEKAVVSFFTNHPEFVNCQANAHLGSGVIWEIR